MPGALLYSAGGAGRLTEEVCPLESVESFSKVSSGSPVKLMSAVASLIGSPLSPITSILKLPLSGMDCIIL